MQNNNKNIADIADIRYIIGEFYTTNIKQNKLVDFIFLPVRGRQERTQGRRAFFMPKRNPVTGKGGIY